MKYSSTIQYEVNKYLPVLMPTKFMPGYKRSELHCRKQAANQQAQESVVRSTRIRTPGNLYIEYQGCRSGILIHLSTHKCLRAGEDTLDRVLRRILPDGRERPLLVHTVRARCTTSILLAREADDDVITSIGPTAAI